MDKLLSMSVFVCTVEEGSFTAAAKKHAISVTMAAKHVTFLERSLKTQLIVRSTRSLVLTYPGKIYAERCKVILREVADADIAVTESAGPLSGRLRITAPQVYGSRKVVPIAVDFAKDFPDVNVEVVLTDHKVDLVREEFDLAFRIGEVQGDWLIAQPITPLSMALVAAPGYLSKHGRPTSPSDLSIHKLIRNGPSQTSNIWTLRRDDITYQIDPSSSKLTINSGEAIRAAAIAGAGIALQPLVTIEDDLDTGALEVVLNKYQIESLSVNLVYSSLKKTTGALKIFMSRALGSLR